jgi:hypothetical protein
MKIVSSIRFRVSTLSLSTVSFNVSSLIDNDPNSTISFIDNFGILPIKFTQPDPMMLLTWSFNKDRGVPSVSCRGDGARRRGSRVLAVCPESRDERDDRVARGGRGADPHQRPEPARASLLVRALAESC